MGDCTQMLSLLDLQFQAPCSPWQTGNFPKFQTLLLRVAHCILFKPLITLPKTHRWCHLSKGIRERQWSSGHWAWHLRNAAERSSLTITDWVYGIAFPQSPEPKISKSRIFISTSDQMTITGLCLLHAGQRHLV